MEILHAAGPTENIKAFSADVGYYSEENVVRR